MLSFAELKKQAAKGAIDTVLVCMVDMQGRLMGKRFHVSNFIESGHEETHCCNYLLATDIEMATPDGYASTSWEKGYGDYVMKPGPFDAAAGAVAGRHGHRVLRPDRSPYPRAGAPCAAPDSQGAG
jgi:glutamine synthetase